MGRRNIYEFLTPLPRQSGPKATVPFAVIWSHSWRPFAFPMVGDCHKETLSRDQDARSGLEQRAGCGPYHPKGCCIFTMAPSRENLRKCMPQLSEARALHFKGQMVFVSRKCAILSFRE